MLILVCKGKGNIEGEVEVSWHFDEMGWALQGYLHCLAYDARIDYKLCIMQILNL